jgi:signal transduction histidine kinase
MLTEEDLKRLEWKAPDYGEMTEQDFLRLLRAVTDLVELESIANRKRHLNMPDLRSWNNFQRQAIIQRKWEIQNGRG